MATGATCAQVQEGQTGLEPPGGREGQVPGRGWEDDVPEAESGTQKSGKVWAHRTGRSVEWARWVGGGGC